MPASFLELPREIRDIIYNYALISPTGYVAPFLCKKLPRVPPRQKPGRKGHVKCLEKPTIRLHLVPCESASNPGTSVHKTSDQALQCGCRLSTPTMGAELPLAFSLPRTCRQIQAETEGVFWEHNTICFPNIGKFPEIMRHMGQTPSRKIRSVQLTIDPARLMSEAFARATKKLASRTRFGDMEHIEVALLGFSKMFRNGTVHEAVEDSSNNNTLCHTLRKAQHSDWARDKDEKKVRRIMLVDCENLHGGTTVVPRYLPWETPEKTLERLHSAWGGKLIFNGDLIWEDGKRVPASYVLRESAND